MLTAAQLNERREAEGWSHRGDVATEGEVLELIYGLIRCQKPEIAIETGTYMGHGTEAISSALAHNDKGHLWTVETNPQFEYRSMRRTTFVQAESLTWVKEDAPENIEFAFIDCGMSDHRVTVAAAVRTKLADTSIVVVHDTVFHAEEHFLADLTNVLGPPSLHLHTLCGVAIWKFDQPQ